MLAAAKKTVRAGQTGLFKFQGRDSNLLPSTPPGSVALSFVTTQAAQTTARLAFLERFSNVFAFAVSGQTATSAIPLAASTLRISFDNRFSLTTAPFFVAPAYPAALRFTAPGATFLLEDQYANAVALPPFKRLDLYLTKQEGADATLRTVSLPFSLALNAFTASETAALSPNAVGSYSFQSSLLAAAEPKTVVAGAVDASRSYAALSASTVAQGAAVTLSFYLFDADGNSVPADATVLAQAAV